ncbi:hypothetical protein GGI07_003712 [Coemansia sp. Benny D115]|nr:hypothetical protein GGI07_003712 [Coemansia sp. Benny D115]
MNRLQSIFAPLVLLAWSLAVVTAEPVVLGYYPSWKRAKMNGIDFSKYTHVNIAFGIPRQDGSFSFEDEWALPQILQQVRANGRTKALLSIGGWTGSNLFSDILKNEHTRESLVNNMANYVDNNKLDGIDIDWEYPGRQGNACNIFDVQNDMPNFLVFLRSLRQAFDTKFGERNKLITLAVRVQPFDTPTGPSTDVKEFSKYVDYANVMAYDISGPWNTETGPNAPFDFERGKGTPLSFVSSIDAWTSAGWPAQQLVAGLGFYGRSSVASQDMTKDFGNQYQPQSHAVPLGDAEDAPWYDACAGITSPSGTWNWKNLRLQGVLTSPNTTAAPWIRHWDDITQTPWLYNTDTKIFLSYDDPDSIKIKSDYAASKGLGGVMVWSANMDYDNELINAARSFGGNMASTGTESGMTIGYYPSWKKAQSANVDFSKYTHINMAFGIPTSSGTISFDGDWFLPQVVTDVHSKGAKVLLSVGGWTGSNLFSTIVKDPGARSTLISSMVNYVKNYNLDGIDIDWEYPGRLGNNCNIYDNANDTPNFLKFLQDLRATFDSTFGTRQKLITLAVRVEPFDLNGGYSTDVSGFAKVVDYANLMQYDINGGWNTETGPNAPFNYEKGKGLQASFVSAIDAWTSAGWPANQLTAGIGFYGRSTIASVDMTKDPTNQYQPQQSVVPLGDSEDAPWYDACAGSTANSGTWMWRHLRDQGVLTSPTTPAAPWVRQWDPISQTPWLFNPSTKQFISYDDMDSLKIKVDYAASKGLAGTMVWSINMDYNNELLDTINKFGTG